MKKKVKNNHIHILGRDDEKHLIILSPEDHKKYHKLSWADRKWGPVCVCGKRHGVFSTPGTNLPKSGKESCKKTK